MPSASRGMYPVAIRNVRCKMSRCRVRKIPAPHRHGKPLVGVERDGIRAFDTRKNAAKLRRHNRRTTPSCVHVKPQVLASTEFRKRRQGIDNSRAGGAGGACNHKWSESLLAIRVDLGRERIHIHPAVRIQRNRANRT
jgi:hypothetical protein